MMKRLLLLVLLAALTHGTFSQTHTFYFVPNLMSWSDAQAYCRRNNHDLATLEEQADLNEMMSVIRPFYDGHVWTGLSRTGKDAPWVWSDQSPSTFIPWAPTQPNNCNFNQNCVAVTPLADLNDLGCTKALPFVCCTERLKLTVRLEVRSGQNVSDPAVMTEILLQMEKRLKESGLIVYAKLSWKFQRDGNVFQTIWKSDAAQQTCPLY